MAGIQKARLGLVENFHERHVGHNSGRYAQRSSQDTAGGQLDETGEEDHRRPKGCGSSRAANQCEGDADVGIVDRHLRFLGGMWMAAELCGLALALLSRHGRHGEAMTSMMLSCTRAARIAVQARKQVKQMFLNDVNETHKRRGQPTEGSKRSSK